MSSTIPITESPTSSASQTPTEQVRQRFAGPGPTLWYGIVALGVFSLILLAIAGRFFVARKRSRRAIQQRQAAERADLERRGEGSELPTYSQSRGQAAGLPGYHTTWDQPSYAPPSSPPPQQHSHFHFHMPSWPSLPVALHLRPAPAEQHAYPPPATQPPPKYEDAPPAIDANASQDGAVMQESNDRAIEEARPYEEEFVHPEERRRREVEQEAARARGDPPL